jgi:2-dehydro-3-deoxygalactonokinase
MNDFLLCCDWGTSSFRLRLVEMGSSKLIGEETSGNGINSVFNSWKTNEEADKISRINFFRQQLKIQIESLADKLSFGLQHIPLVISGMATSSIGMKELPYASLPFPIDGKNAKVKFLEAQENFPHKLLLISGIRSANDVMRGEETQLMGLINILENTYFCTKETVFIFPGTHSKHIYMRNSKIVDFHTFITGEMFSLLSHYSILKDSIENPQHLPFTNDENLEWFKKGIGASGSSNILNSLFTVRTNHLFANLQKVQNFFYLSGLLIGAELRSLVGQNHVEVVLCSGKNLAQFYQNGLEELNLLNRITLIKPELIDRATIAGQVKMYQNLDKNKINKNE